jgi:hypothetical protein
LGVSGPPSTKLAEEMAEDALAETEAPQEREREEFGTEL